MKGRKVYGEDKFRTLFTTADGYEWDGIFNIYIVNHDQINVMNMRDTPIDKLDDYREKIRTKYYFDADKAIEAAIPNLKLFSISDFENHTKEELKNIAKEIVIKTMPDRTRMRNKLTCSYEEWLKR